MPSRAPRDLTDFARRQIAELVAIELSVLGESHVIDIEIEAHANGICRDQIIDITGLIKIDLSVTRARTERAHDDRRTPTLAPYELGD